MDAPGLKEFIEVRRMTAHQADRELSHLEVVLKSSTGQIALTAVRGMDLAYWAARVVAIETHYDLMVSQKRRIAALLRMLNTMSLAAHKAPAQEASAARIAA